MTEQNDKPGKLHFSDSGVRTFDHVDILVSGWVMCRNGTHGKDAEVTFYPPHRVAKIDRETETES